MTEPELEPERLERIDNHWRMTGELDKDDYAWLLGRYRDTFRVWRHTISEREALRALLGRLEWSGMLCEESHPGGGDVCPSCDMNRESGHGPTCELAKAIGRR